MGDALLSRERRTQLEAAIVTGTATREETREMLRHAWAAQSEVANLEGIVAILRAKIARLESGDDALELAEFRRQAREARTVP